MTTATTDSINVDDASSGQTVASSSKSSYRARARWAILRQALLSQSTASSHRRPTFVDNKEGASPETPYHDVSIHRFPGFQMIPRQMVDVTGDIRERLPRVVVKQLQRVGSYDNDNRIDAIANWLEAAVLAFECCEGFVDNEHFVLDIHLFPWDEAFLQLLQESLHERGVTAQVMTEPNSLRLSQLSTGQPEAKKRAFEYHLPTNGSDAACESSPTVVTREPDHSDNAATKPRLDLTQLASHHYYNGIDNTGNICVWDSSRTCAWLATKSCYGSNDQDVSPICRRLGIQNLWDLATEKTDAIPNECSATTTMKLRCLKVLELGAGMAGLPSLALAALRECNIPGDVRPRIQITISDGHPNAVRNNRVNALLTLSCSSDSQYHLDSATLPSSITLDCQRRLWTKEPPNDNTELQNQDLVIVCDCTHFEEYHEELLMTILSTLRLGGVALLCQPPRGQSLSRFLSRVESCQQMEMYFVEIPELVQRHEYWMQQQQRQQNDTSESCHQMWYDPSIHCPQVVLLRKTS